MSTYVTVTAVLFTASLVVNVARGCMTGWSTARALDVAIQAALVTWALTL